MKLKEHYGLIYLITIKSSGLIYVGQTIDLTRRIKEYRNKIKKQFTGRTHYKYIQEFQNKKSKRIIAFKDKTALIFDGAKLFGDKFGFNRTNVTAVTKGKGNRLGGFYLFYLDCIDEIKSVYEKRKSKNDIKYKEYLELFELVIKGVETIENNGYKIEYICYE